MITISELYSNISSDFRSKLNLSDDELKTVLDALASSLAGQFKLSYLALEDNKNEQFPDTATLSANGGTLERQGYIYLNRNIRPATSTVMNLNVTGVAGSVMRSGLTFKSNDNSLNPNKVYTLDAEYTLTGTDDVIEVRSLLGGSDVNLLVGNALTITEPVIGVEQGVTVNSITSQGLAAESTEDYRNAILDAIQLEPQGGSKTDYRLWANDAQGVRLVYPYVKDSDAGTMQIYVEATEEDSTDGNGTPSAEMLEDVYDVIQFDPDETIPTYNRGRRPAQATIETIAISLNPVDIEITGLDVSTAEVQASIEENLKAYIKTVRPFVAGGDLSRNKNDTLYSARLQSITTDVIDASNFFTNFTMQVNGTSQNSYLFSRENIPYLRNLTFV